MTPHDESYYPPGWFQGREREKSLDRTYPGSYPPSNTGGITMVDRAPSSSASSSGGEHHAQEPQDEHATTKSSRKLDVAEYRSRHNRSPSSMGRQDRSRRSDRYSDRHDDDYAEDRGWHAPMSLKSRTPMAESRNLVNEAFTDSSKGIGAGVLGALVGGFVAHEASEAVSRRGKRGERVELSEAEKRNQLLTTVVGAAVGALGANAVEKRLEANRDRDRDRYKLDWPERQQSSSSRGSVGYIDRPLQNYSEVVERREVVRQPRGSRKHRERDGVDRSNERGKGRGISREVDPDARSWRNVEDWVNEFGDQGEDRGRSAEPPAYRW